jgi:hypothetical protein
VFEKERAWRETGTDLGDNRPPEGVVVVARNYAWTIAERLGWTHFAVWDDDYTRFVWLFGSEPGRLLKDRRNVKNLGRVFEIACDFLDETPTDVFAFVQTGDLIGGNHGKWTRTAGVALNEGAVRKAMNFYVFRTDRRQDFYGRLNEDVCAYVLNGMRGALYFSSNYLLGMQQITQHNPGGLTDAYLNLGTYVKSFYALMMAPGSVQIAPLATENARIHHVVRWDYTTPRILRESVKKE